MEQCKAILHIFNVDHGACALLSIRDWFSTKIYHVLIDCGHSTDLNGRRWTPGAELSAINIRYVDMLICTNYDEDHASGVPSLIEHDIHVGCILGNPSVPAAVIEHLKSKDGMGAGIQILVQSLAERAANGKAQVPPNIPGLELMWAWNPWPHFDDENNLSLVAHLEIFGFKFLFPGDMEKAGFENLLRNETISSWMPQLDVLMASHHGRESGRYPPMFEDHGCRPQLIIISDCAKKHQSQETANYYYLKAIGIASFRNEGPRSVLTTRTDKYIRFEFNGVHKNHGGTCNVS